MPHRKRTSSAPGKTAPRETAPRKSAARASDAAPPVTDYRHDASRRNIPPAGLAAQARVRETPKLPYAYDAHRPPELRFDATGGEDALPPLLAEATRRKLTDDEARLLAHALRHREPWLEWAGKRETKGFLVDPVALHIHERVSAQAILKAAQREDVQRDLFAEPRQGQREALQFYQHDVGWANRMILGDSLQVMASLARREDLAGKVQMIYMDPPYGIRYASNFQSEIGRRDVKDKEQDLTREPEMVKAYRDTWTLGVHSYLAYLRDRLMLCRELLTDSGSIFVQISDENLHRVRAVMDEVFGAENFCSQIVFRKTTGKGGELLDNTYDLILWYCNDREHVKYRALFEHRTIADDDNLRMVETRDGQRRRMLSNEISDPSALPHSTRVFRPNPFTNQRPAQGKDVREYTYQGRRYTPGAGTFRTDKLGIDRLASAERLLGVGNTLTYVRFLEDLPFKPRNDIWDDTRQSGFGESKVYVVQTATRVIERCMLMTSDPGDLVLDPTCGSGTTAYVAEQWGRRWITTDTSRVAISIARQRLLTSNHDQYRVKAPVAGNGAHRDGDPANGFVYRTVPHVTLKSITRNAGLDPIFARHQPILDAALATLNAALAKVTPALRTSLKAKLAEKTRREGKRAVTDADRRRWELPAKAWQEWEVPFDADLDWPAPLRDARTAYRAAWRAKMDEVNAAIAANADQEELVDQPEVVPGVVRVSGPFTVEAVMPAAEGLDEAESPIDGEHDDLETFADAGVTAGPGGTEPANAEAYLDRMRRLLVTDGVRFPNNRQAAFTRLDPIADEWLHAEGDWNAGTGSERRVAVSFGPQHGPVTAVQVEEALFRASRRGYDDVVFAGFSFDGAAQGIVQDDPNPRVRAHLAHIRPDVQMGGLLKKTADAQLFTVFGTPRTELRQDRDGTYTVEMEGVDVYDPVNNTLTQTGADKVAAWFVDTDYDGRTFCITQAFFPDRSAWDRLARALKSTMDPEVFEAMAGTVSLPFEAGANRRVAVKVIDPRGNEVMRVHRLPAEGARAAR